MFSFGKPLPNDHSEVAKQTKSRLFDEERKKRIFNPATRTIGVSNCEHSFIISDNKDLDINVLDVFRGLY